jgi:peptide-methionine (S)-S-oxide reductase
VTTQRSILLLSIGLAVVYVWLRGGFLGLAAVSPAAAPQLPTMQPGWDKAVFAMGCFWSAESDFDKLNGVKFTTSGYTGGRVSNPSYEQVSRGATGHAEAIEVAFDPAVVTYDQVLDYFWHHVDPFVSHRQFCDVGAQYRPEIFVRSEAQRAAAEASKKRIEMRFRDPIVVGISNARTFYPADESHQDYYLKHPTQYRYYRWTCGRDARLQEIWGT